MAAVDLFERTLRDLPGPRSKALAELIQRTREDLHAARSEDARERIVREYLKGVHDLAEQAAR
jgi:hypothetical protein